MVGMESLQYLFDIQGYLVLKDVLSKRETDTLNQLVDAQELDESTAITHSRFGIAPEGAGFLEYGQPFCDLLDHPQSSPATTSWREARYRRTAVPNVL